MMRLDAEKAANRCDDVRHSRRGARLCRVVAFAVNEAAGKEVELR
jgi:hypothetical protein